MKLEDFNYQLPSSYIAQKPHNPRDQARLLKLDRYSGAIIHTRFDHIFDYLKAGDVLVINNSQVFPARLIGFKKESGGRIEVFLHQERSPGVWECLIKGKLRPGVVVAIGMKLKAELVKDQGDGTVLVKFNLKGQEFWREVESIGQVPLPPYIRADEKKKNQERYQTVYADIEQKGSVAAPTAGLHFTKRLLTNLESKGIEIVPVSLHVGLGTFAGVKTEDITKHPMHHEAFSVSPSSLKAIILAKKEQRRIIAVGTTSCRVLESLAPELNRANFSSHKTYRASTNIFIYPGYRFQLVDALITNFHLPKSTLLMLVSALAGSDSIKNAYEIAIAEHYRFYSYGDAMIII